MDSNFLTTSTQRPTFHPPFRPKPKLKFNSHSTQEITPDTSSKLATAPLDRMPNPGTLYRWEDNAGLDHKCGTCKTVLSSPRAKKTCFGQHEEVCSKYHRTLFMIGEAHKCEACRRSRETHDKRHREIAVLVEAILELDERNGLSTPVSGTKRKARKSDDLFDVARDGDDASERGGDMLDNTGVKDQVNIPPTLCTPNTKEAKRGQKLKKAERKTAKSQSRVKVISNEDIRRIADAIHPPTDSTLKPQNDARQNSDDPLDNHLASVPAPSDPYRNRIRKSPSVGAKKPGKFKTAPPQSPTLPSTSADEMARVLRRLNVKVVVLAACKERRGLLAKLQDAVQTDLTIVDNEDRDTMMREAGYFRYVNRRTYNAMVQNNLIWDWVGGGKLEEMGEGDEDDDEGAGEGSESVAGDDGCDGVGRCEVEDYADDFVFDGRELRLVGQHVAVDYFHTERPAPLELALDSVHPSPVPEDSGPCELVEPSSPDTLCEESVPESSNALLSSVRTGTGVAEDVQVSGRDGNGNAEHKPEHEAEQQKAVDTTYAITNLEPELPWD